MNVFVTGATGFVGSEVVHDLAERGHAIRILTRSAGSSALEEVRQRCGAAILIGDLIDPVSLGSALKGVDAIIHLVGIISEIGRNTFENAHVVSTSNLVQAARRWGIERFVHMSALGTRPNAASRYHQTKWTAEETVRHSGLGYTIFRPSLIYGRRDHFVNTFAKLIRFSPILPVIPTGTARFQPVAVEVVASALVKALDEVKSIGRTLDLCGPKRLTFPEMLDVILAVMRRRRLKVRLPTPLIWCQAAFLEWFYPGLLRQAAPLNRDQLIMLREGSIGDPELADRLLGLQHLEFDQGVAKYLRT